MEAGEFGASRRPVNRRRAAWLRAGTAAGKGDSDRTTWSQKGRTYRSPAFSRSGRESDRPIGPGQAGFFRGDGDEDARRILGVSAHRFGRL